MIRDPSQVVGRRVPAPPTPLQGELVRARVLEPLTSRFNVPITTVVAGAGFGKTTAMAQAIRANDAAPRGIDAWVACEPGDEDVGRLSRAVASALGTQTEPGPRPGVNHVLQALRAVAPLDICVFFDDVHELPEGSSGERFLIELADRLPPHAHLVLASRGPVPVPLARRRAAGQVVDVAGEDLAFTGAEIQGLASHLGMDPGACEGLAGWPSLVRLVLSAPVGAARQFLWEEIVAGLLPAERAGLLALAILGSGTTDEVSRVAGVEVDVDRLQVKVPLVSRDGDGRLGLHALWEEAVERIYPRAEVRDARTTAVEVIAERGDTVAMGSTAVRWGEPAMFRTACVALVGENLGMLPVDTAARWLADVPPDAVGTPEQRLLEVALGLGEQPTSEHLADRLDALVSEFEAIGHRRGVAVSLMLGGVTAHSCNDTARLIALMGRARAFPVADRGSAMGFFDRLTAAAQAGLRGDPDEAVRTIESIEPNTVPGPFAELVLRLHVTMLVLAGRAREAIAVGRPLELSPKHIVRQIPTFVRWSAGEPLDPITRHRVDGPGSPDVEHPYRLFSAAHATMVSAALGDRDQAAAWLGETEASLVNPSDSRDAALLLAAVTACRILDHADDDLPALVSDHLERFPLSDARGEVHLRHDLAIPYVANEVVRERWDSIGLGPSHERVRAITRRLLDARRGDIDQQTRIGEPAAVITALPLPWTVELAVRATAAGCSDADVLVRYLAGWLPVATRRELEWQAAHGDPTCRSTASALLVDLPDTTTATVAIDVLGPVRLSTDGIDIGGPQLRRARVRTLLSLLVLRGEVRRERICDLLWPDLDPPGGARNLRVTLSHLRKLFDSATTTPRSTWAIHASRDTIGLARPPLVVTDLQRLDRHLADADHSEKLADSSAVIAALTAAVDLWRGAPLADLATVDELGGEIEFYRRSVVDACQRLGELLLVSGRFDEALRCAERSRAAEPYSERAHRLVIACHLRRHDRTGLADAVDTTRHMLHEVGAEPEEATAILLRRVETPDARARSLSG